MFIKKYLFFILCISLLAPGFITTSAGARDISFSWTANQEQVDGYKLYYDTDTTGPPYEGTGAAEGNSPVTITGGQSAQASLHGLSDTATYHFTLTAFRGNDQSGYSTEITLQPENINDKKVTAHFAWTPNTESNLAGYKIHYGTNHGTYTKVTDIGNPVIGSDNKVHGNVQQLTEGTTYYFACTAYDDQGNESGYSQEIEWTATSQSSADISDGAGADTNPDANNGSAENNGSTGNNGSVDTNHVGGKTVTAHFAWTPNTESNLAGYKIHYGTNHGTYTKVTDIGNPVIGSDNKVHGNVQQLTEGTTYYFACTAYDDQGNESGYSQEIEWTATSQSSADISDGAGADTNPDANNGSAENNGSAGNNGSVDTNPVGETTHPTNGLTKSVQFKWTANQEQVEGYRLYYKTGPEGGPIYNGAGVNEGDSPIDVGNVTSFRLTGLEENKRYYFTMTAYLGAEESGYSKEIVLWTGDTPAAPAIMNIEVK